MVLVLLSQTTVELEKADLSFRIPGYGMIPLHLHNLILCHSRGLEKISKIKFYLISDIFEN